MEFWDGHCGTQDIMLGLHFWSSWEQSSGCGECQVSSSVTQKWVPPPNVSALPRLAARELHSSPNLGAWITETGHCGGFRVLNSGRLQALYPPPHPSPPVKFSMFCQAKQVTSRFPSLCFQGGMEMEAESLVLPAWTGTEFPQGCLSPQGALA